MYLNECLSLWMHSDFGSVCFTCEGFVVKRCIDVYCKWKQILSPTSELFDTRTLMFSARCVRFNVSSWKTPVSLTSFPSFPAVYQAVFCFSKSCRSEEKLYILHWIFIMALSETMYLKYQINYFLTWDCGDFLFLIRNKKSDQSLSAKRE